MCSRIAATGWIAGIGQPLGVDPRKIDNTSLLVLWGTNATATPINVMTHYHKARNKNGAKLVIIDPYYDDTAQKCP